MTRLATPRHVDLPGEEAITIGIALAVHDRA
jgi:hypothetical protein